MLPSYCHRCVYTSLLLTAFATTHSGILAQTCDLAGASGYYDSVDVNDENQLHNLLQSPHQEVPFSAFPETDIWDALIDLDGDASGGLVRLIYKDVEHDNTPAVANSYDREHLWPREHGVGYSGPDYTDVHAMRPAFWLNKAARGSRYFSNCGIANPQSDCISPAGIDFAATTEIDTSTFAPPANRRGDIARAIFYMAMRYDGSESNTEDLTLTDCPTGDNAGEYGYLSQLLQWHMDDPVDASEQQRNDQACRQWQGNRNPFVDIPVLVHHYFGYPRIPLGDGLGYDCAQPNPTEFTTRQPTVAPTTSQPTTAPTTAEPSSSPTNSPTDPPTNAPTTAEPTAAPTKAPTDPPTNAPTTSQPTIAPTTAEPSAAPTKAPTDPPTKAPTPPSYCNLITEKQDCHSSADEPDCIWVTLPNNNYECHTVSCVACSGINSPAQCGNRGCTWESSLSVCTDGTQECSEEYSKDIL